MVANNEHHQQYCSALLRMFQSICDFKRRCGLFHPFVNFPVTYSYCYIGLSLLRHFSSHRIICQEGPYPTQFFGAFRQRSRHFKHLGQSSWLRSGGPGSIPGTTRRKKVVGPERGPLSLVSTTKELLDRKVAAPV
jgi:hypothetical protein